MRTNNLINKTIVTAIFAGALGAMPAAESKYTDWGTPVNLGPNVNSNFDDNHPQISRDGLSLFFHSNRPGGLGGEDIWVSQRPSADAAWELPQNLGPAINTDSNDRVPYLFPGEQWLLFGSTRPGGFGGIDLWISRRSDKRDDFSWEPAINVGSGINTASDDDGAALFEDDHGRLVLYFTSNRPGGAGDFDLYEAVQQQPDGTFGIPSPVAGINGPGRDTRTAVTRDGLEFFLTSNRSGSQLLDIWTAAREDTDSNWPTLSKVSFVSSANEGAPGISFDRQTLFFYSNRGGGYGGNDLYMTTRTRTRGSGR